MFKILWITAAAIVAIGWIAYGVWRVIDHLQERKRPKPGTKHLQEVKKSFEEYAKKLEKFEKPTHKR
jgi:type VI protein secretion system component VasK